MILDGRQVASHTLENIRNAIAGLDTKNDRPHLAVVLVGDNPASLAYIRNKRKRTEEVGMDFSLHRFSIETTQEELESAVQHLCSQNDIHGVIIQAPLPAHIDSFRITECIDPQKDVDGFTRSQIGNMFLGHDGLWSCTPRGIMTLLDHYNIDVSGKKVAVIGRSNIVGKPMALMLINRGATVTSCNSKTPQISHITQESDIVIVAIGKARWLTKEMVSPQAVILDVGSNLQDDGSFCGDVDFENMKDFVRAISPSPGGVGPMTIATLIENTWKAYQAQKNAQ